MAGSDTISLAQLQNEPVLPAAGSSFYMAMRILPAAQRQAMFEIYAFCRAVDDIADGNAPACVRRAGLEQWQRDIDSCYAGAPPARLLNLYRQITAYKLEHADFRAVIDGMMMDADTAICAPDATTLDTYCDRVASAVGRLSVKVFGMRHDEGIVLAHHLGRALQLTNILRDIDEDAGMGRVYLPREALLTAGIEPGTANTIIEHPLIPAACAALAGQAQTHYQAAEAIMARNPRRLVRAPRLMSAAYHTTLLRLLARGWTRPRHPVKVPRLQRIGILLRFAFL